MRSLLEKESLDVMISRHPEYEAIARRFETGFRDHLIEQFERILQGAFENEFGNAQLADVPEAKSYGIAALDAAMAAQADPPYIFIYLNPRF